MFALLGQIHARLAQAEAMRAGSPCAVIYWEFF